MVFCRQTTRAPDRQRCPPVHCPKPHIILGIGPHANGAKDLLACLHRQIVFHVEHRLLPVRVRGLGAWGQSWFSWAVASPLASCPTPSPTPTLTFLLPGTNPNDQLLSTDYGQPALEFLYPPPALERKLFKFHVWEN